LKSWILKIFLIIFCFVTSLGYAQFSAGANDTINPGVPVTLTATYGEIGLPVTIDDDGVEGPFPIGFSFRFFGNVFTEFYIGANGWISFSPNASSSGIRAVFAVPSSINYNPKNCILGPFVDLLPKTSENYIYYLTVGDAPDRKLVVMWCQAPMYWCQDLKATFQIILEEGSNSIENHIFNKPECTELNTATLGLQNSTGLTGFAVPGRNATSWSAAEEGWRYQPVSVDSFAIAPVSFNLVPITPGNKINYQWYEGSSLIGEEQSVVVAPSQTTVYRVVMTLCDGEQFDTTVTVVVLPNIPNAFSPNGDGANDKFRIVGLPVENITKFNLQIFNRWGQVVFSTTDIMDSWDGRMNGQDCPPGLYAWAIFYEDNKKVRVSNKGSLMLVR
jgi:gliding motility-associated-like protein